MLAIEKAQEILKPFARPAWIPITECRGTEVLESKYGGVPWMKTGEDWPLCALCRKEPLLFVLQLNVAALPAPVRNRLGGEGLVQLFYADHGCFPEEDAGDPTLSSLSLIRVIRPEEGKANVAPPRNTPQPIVERAITGWREWTDYPNWEERGRLSIPIEKDSPEEKALDALDPVRKAEKEIMDGTDEGKALLAEIAKKLGRPELSRETFAAWHALSGPLVGDKLGGWERWAQGPERQRCAVCDKPNDLLYQLNASELSTDYWTTAYAPGFFASDGTGHISYCTNHPSRLRFHSACG